jgi:enoyl-CoA hydratase/carnithine racemase
MTEARGVPAAVGQVHVEHRGVVTVVTLNNPPAGALSDALLSDLAAALTSVREDRARVVVLRSAVPRYFGAGADLKLLSEISVSGFIEYLDRVRAVIEQIAELGCVTIAAIDGKALGGGFELALACTFRVAGPAAELGLPEVKLGLLPGAGGTQRLTRLAGRDTALDVILSGRTLDAVEACKVGLVSRVAETSADSDALLWAAELAQHPPEAASAILRCIEAALPATHAGGMAIEAEEIYRLFSGDAATRAVARFVSTRPAGG